MAVVLVVACLLVLWLAGLFSKDEWGKDRLPLNAGIAPALLAAIPSVLGVVGSLFKGKKAKYSTNHNPQQAEAYKMLLNQLMQRMRSGQQSPVQQMGNQSLNQLSQMFYGTPYAGQGGGQQQMPIPQGGAQPGRMNSFAEGGVAWQPQVAQVGENGPEAIIPLKNMMGGAQQGMGMQSSMQQQPSGAANPWISQLRSAATPMGGAQQGMGLQQGAPSGMVNQLRGAMGQGQQMGVGGGLQNSMGQMQGSMGQLQQGQNPMANQNMMRMISMLMKRRQMGGGYGS